ncbi:MAG: GumC family protein [Pseudomonadota bacterium]
MATDQTQSMQQWGPVNEAFIDDEVHLLDYIDVILRRRKLVFFIFLAVSSGAVLFAEIKTPVYEATATMIIDQEISSSPITGERVDYGSHNSQTLTFNTHSKLITSRPVIKRVVQDLHLDSENRAEGQASDSMKASILMHIQTMAQTMGWGESQEKARNRDIDLYDDIARKITVNQVRDTRLLKISVKDKDPEEASRIANSFAGQYIEFTLSNRSDSSQKNLEWIKTELYSLKTRLEEDEKKFLIFKEQNQIVTIQGKQKMFEQKITEFNNNYLETHNKRLELDAIIDELHQCSAQGKTLIGVRALVDTPLIASSYSKVLSLEIEYSKLNKIFKPRHPKLIQLQEELYESRQKLAIEIKNEAISLKAQRNVLLARETVLKKSMSEFEKEALEISSRELEYLTLQRNVNASQKLYDALLERLKESDILKTSDASNLSIIEKAEAPAYPVSPRMIRNLALGMVAGLFLGCLMAFVLDYLDQTVRTENDIEDYLDLKVLSVIPESEQPGLVESTIPDTCTHYHPGGKGIPVIYTDFVS